ncbi:hypothetical protein HPP92_018996 [Vanilla planifolia]|uniref:Uncharacterized protein n=1 Tax=Vanilla planifolia TaxID=51239 RepID=A0A835QBM8_VANPL|nr:hypothetical protein HPP92_018996 [Vanilla planifolia]
MQSKSWAGFRETLAAKAIGRSSAMPVQIALVLMLHNMLFFGKDVVEDIELGSLEDHDRDLAALVGDLGISDDEYDFPSFSIGEKVNLSPLDGNQGIVEAISGRTEEL